MLPPVSPSKRTKLTTTCRYRCSFLAPPFVASRQLQPLRPRDLALEDAPLSSARAQLNSSDPWSAEAQAIASHCAEPRSPSHYDTPCRDGTNQHTTYKSPIMPIRNPFARKPGALAHDENLRPEQVNGQQTTPGFERVDTVGSKASSVLSIRSAKSHDTGEYKMSVVNDSGVYLPVSGQYIVSSVRRSTDREQPSPTEEKGQWPRKYLSSRASSDTRSSFGDIEHFSISRESFDSYRRSFDISARSPITGHDMPTRQSLDSARFPRLPRSAIDRRMMERQPPTAEEGFEDVGLDDHKQPPRKRGFFSKFGDSQDKDGHLAEPSPVSRFLMPVRKRGHSGQGSELGAMDRPQTADGR
ncbi:hypothetical protein PCL_08318 [Purpureocillium lilacinum]|uniref:Uncharacterized protein n=1 Tax=Purpureocillium lilacinum TaxID=33203 RepID=A0A2U3EKG6_PURLI|nr:hypothetical protein PCL_08318 [Purpureocillium lilacinum]